MARAKKTKGLSGVYAKLNKQYGPEIFRPYNASINTPVIPTGSVIMDRIIGPGGIPRGRLVEFFGLESTGKTTLALQVLSQARRMGLRCAYLDAEQAMYPSLVDNLGIDFETDPDQFGTSDCLYAQPLSFETAEMIIDGIMEEEENPFGLVVVDSIPAMIPEKEADVEPGQPAPVGLQARLLSRLFKKLAPKARMLDTSFIFINHVRVDMGNRAAWGPPKMITPGGNTPRYMYSVRLSLKVIKRVKEVSSEDIMGDRDELPVYNIIRVQAEKNKVGYPYLQGDIALVYGRGTDNVFSVMKVALNKKIIQTKGSWYVYEGVSQDGECFEFKVQGERALREHLNSNPELIEHLCDECGLIRKKGEVEEASWQDPGSVPVETMSNVLQMEILDDED